MSDNTQSGAAQHDSAAANQAKSEPLATAPEDSAQASDGGAASAGSSSRASGEGGEAPAPAEVDDAAGAAATAASVHDGGIPTPGDSQGVAVPSVQAAAGTSEESEQVDGVNITALAPPGKPDGEVDTRA